MNKRIKIFALSLFGGALLTTGAIATSIALVSCNTNKPIEGGKPGEGNTTNGIFGYKPSPEVNNLLPEDKYNKIKDNYLKEVQFQNANWKNDNFAANKKAVLCALDICQLKDNVLTIQYSTFIDYNWPLKLPGEEIFLPPSIDINTIKTYQLTLTNNMQLDLINFTKVKNYTMINIINGQKISQNVNNPIEQLDKQKMKNLLIELVNGFMPI